MDEKQNAAAPAGTSETTGSVSKTLISEQTFRSTPLVNQDDDMVRVTIDMKRTVWWGWKKQLIKAGMKQNASLSLPRGERG